MEPNYEPNGLFQWAVNLNRTIAVYAALTGILTCHERPCQLCNTDETDQYALQFVDGNSLIICQNCAQSNGFIGACQAVVAKYFL
jgi:hypothetical protein